MEKKKGLLDLKIENVIIYAFNVQGMSGYEIAKIFNCSKSLIYKIIARHKKK